MTTQARSPRRAATQQKLLEAATRTFAERGILAASVEEICEAAGFTRGAFYSNFSSKDELCIALLTDYCEGDLAAAASAISDVERAVAGKGLEELVRAAIVAFTSLQRSDTEWVLVNAELRLHAARTPAIREAYARFLDEAAEPMARMVKDALGSIGYRLTLPDPQAMGLLRAIWYDSLMTSLFDATHPLATEDLQENLVVMLLAMTEPVAE